MRLKVNSVYCYTSVLGNQCIFYVFAIRNDVAYTIWHAKEKNKEQTRITTEVIYRRSRIDDEAICISDGACQWSDRQWNA